MNNLIFFSEHNQTKQWMKMIHHLDHQSEQPCFLEYRGHPQFATRLLGRITGMVHRFQDKPQTALYHLQKRATVLWKKNHLKSQNDDFHPTSTPMNVADIVIFPKPKIH